MNWLFENLGTILVGAAVLLAVVLILVKMWKDKKKGVSSCGCGCSSCAMAGTCHGNRKNTDSSL